MSVPRAKLLCLTLLAVFRNGEAGCRTENISCPCGSSGSTVQLSHRLSCLSKSIINEDPCNLFKNCATCRTGLDQCLTCPSGKSGFFCNQDRPAKNEVADEYLYLRRKVRQETSQFRFWIFSVDGCPELRSPRPGSISCTYDDERASCTGKCSPGHAFPNGQREMIFECNYNSRRWFPLPSFPSCRSLGQCDLELEGAGSYNCTINDRGTFCDIFCSSWPPFNGRFFCFPGREWEPRLPYCARKKVMNGGGDRCKCVNGGTCRDSTSECTCPPDYEGVKCEKWKECGIVSKVATTRVTGGEETVPGEFPWQVAIATNPSGIGWNIVCGGVLITRDRILTAAHCLTSTRAEDYRLYMGKYYLYNDDEDNEVEEKTPSRLIIHPRYNIDTPLDADIAVIHFNSPVTFSDMIRPICLTDTETSRTNLVPGGKGLVTGWGLTENQTQSETLLKAELPVVSTEDCRKSYQEKRINIQLTDNMYCAGHEEGRTDACEGDSGGPMMFRSGSNKNYVLEGLISFGSPEGCGQPKHYSGYTKVINFIDWIRENI